MAITVERLRRTFGSFTAVDDLSFQVAAGEIVGLIGPNGAGKTTTLRCLAGILRPTSGHVRIDGHDIVESDDLARYIAFRKPGEKVDVTILRDGDEQDVEVTLGTRPDSISAG